MQKSQYARIKASRINMTLSANNENFPAPRPACQVVRYADLIPCFNAFIDTRTPGSDKKENFTIIGPGVSENPEQHVHIKEPHGFNIGAARQPPGCVNSQHSHETEEVFFVHSGTWSFNVGEKGDDAKVKLKPGDLISIPTGVFRGFENVGDDIGFLWAILGRDDPGHVLWAPDVFDMAKDYGLVLLEDGCLIDTNKGDSIPDGKRPMPGTTDDQIAELKTFSEEQLRDCCVFADQLNDGARKLIGNDGQLSWPHGFEIEQSILSAASSITPYEHAASEVVFVHEGELTILTDDQKTTVNAGDTATISPGTMRSYSNQSASDVNFLVVRGNK